MRASQWLHRDYAADKCSRLAGPGYSVESEHRILRTLYVSSWPDLRIRPRGHEFIRWKPDEAWNRINVRNCGSSR